MNKLVNNVSNGGKDNGLDDHATFPHHDEGLGLELIREESNAPLLPQRPPRIPQENSESFFPLLTNEQTEDENSPPHSHQRDSLYTSMPMLPGLPDVSQDSAHCKDSADTKSQEASSDDVYYKSMPNLGSRNHLHQLHSYYQLGRGSSDGFIVPPNKEDAPEEGHPDASQLVTSL
uniref:GPCR family 2 latrophilin C-terminal domain-containing protein n=1 Tax=Periophthalmus magnuspinnatus TaxID=409849 RepID=A0A3B4ACA9_9GOBI